MRRPIITTTSERQEKHVAVAQGRDEGKGSSNHAERYCELAHSGEDAIFTYIFVRIYNSEVSINSPTERSNCIRVDGKLESRVRRL